MSAEKKAREALAGLHIPIELGTYRGGEEEYISIFSDLEEAQGFADDSPVADLCSIQVQYVCPVQNEYEEKKKLIKKLLFHAGFTYPAITQRVDATIRQVVFDCEIDLETRLED